MTDLPGGQGGDADSGELTRSDMALVRQSLRQDWGLSPDNKIKILKRLCAYLDPESVHGATAKPRTVIASAKTIAEFMRLQLAQQKIDVIRSKIEGTAGGSEKTLADLVAEAETRATTFDEQRDEKQPGE